ncbi:16S rRNA (guanine(966)-N(2))-methyltransferase RsmD [Euhalothece natronophila Z-M001]|uniref:16S rRNA (Guanine(966)-N(2))-methyltransferase RsmD n=1 Tax=Euhalothece natronophila Z-M001 TaxID=522448 RepID=A0A5B8NMY3_9CHRO|nr:16S rRNA (guanine(966)-N(2))-methyltransferase RsmD [Euhalothece natronophila]QDZ39640.1 16S rRNA (guanine(966)-N(2))-methyltransferase RsmD [Euhalothece natronophila Z-M001]
MRIYGNRLLKTLPGDNTRPTSAKVREALFNIWQGNLKEAHWLDLCAGNGTIGAEALCRGITYLVGIEKYPKACRIIQENWQKVASLEQEFRVLKGDVQEKIKALQGEEFHFIYFDPPYGSDLYDSILRSIVELKLLAVEGEIAVEHDPKQWNNHEIEGLELIRQKKYGNTYLTFFQTLYSNSN